MSDGFLREFVARSFQGTSGQPQQEPQEEPRSQGTVYAAPKRPDIIPANYDELFTAYYDYVVGLVVTSGIDVQNAEDVAMTILATFFEKDVLSRLRSKPAHRVRRGCSQGGVPDLPLRLRQDLRPPLPGPAKHQQVCEPIILDTPMNDGTDSGALIDFIGLVHNDDHSGVSYDRFVRSGEQSPQHHQASRATQRNAHSLCSSRLLHPRSSRPVTSTSSNSSNSLWDGRDLMYNWLHRLRDELSKLSL